MKKSLTAFYASGAGFSGQRFAAELLIDGLRQKSWEVTVITIPAFDRVKESSETLWNRVSARLKLPFLLSISWLKIILTMLKYELIYVTIGQTKLSLIREGFPLMLKTAIRLKKKAVISLNGNLFLNWNSHSLETRLFRAITKGVNYVTVVGPRQKHKLIQLGIPEQKLVIMDNTCGLTPLPTSEILKKQKFERNSSNFQNPFNILYLSSLIESKGYAEFVEAISIISKNSDIFLNVVLCGSLTIGRSDSERFLTHADAKYWLEDKILQINKSPRVRLCWIDGTQGEQKTQLFREAQIFVLPSRYKVEAQPISILEALASGCAVITTKVGEIPTTVTSQTALLLDKCSSILISEAISNLCREDNRRINLALEGNKLFQERFSYEKYINRWEKILKDM